MSTLPYTKRGQQQRRHQALLRAVYKDFRSWYMVRRPDWNRMGPQLPLWFREQLKRIDRRLVLQFIPPRSAENPGGTGSQWPNGAWYICGKIPRTKWITRRAVFVLVDKDGSILPPDRQLVNILRHARRLRRRCLLDGLDKMYEDQADRLMREGDELARARLLEDIVTTMRKRNMVSRAQPRVFIPAPA